MLQDDTRGRPQNLLVIEPHFDGHRGVYVNWIVRGAIERGYRVTLATLSSTTSHPLWAQFNKIPKASFESVLVERARSDSSEVGTLSLIAQEIKYWMLFKLLFRESCKTNHIDFVLAPYLDYCANAVAILGTPFGKVPWSGIVMRQVFHFPPRDGSILEVLLLKLKKYLFKRALGSKEIECLFTIDEALMAYMRTESHPSFSHNLILLCDPAQMQGEISQDNARRMLGIPLGCPVILVYGWIDNRKGIDALLDSLAGNARLQEVHVFVAGWLSNSVKEMAKHPMRAELFRGNRIHLLDKFLTKDEEFAAFKAATFVWLGYRNHLGMSGVLVQAGQMKLPVIACSAGLIGWITKAAKSGVVIDINNPSEVAYQISCLLDDKDLAERCGENGYRKFASHSSANFFDSILRHTLERSNSSRLIE